MGLARIMRDISPLRQVIQYVDDLRVSITLVAKVLSFSGKPCKSRLMVKSAFLENMRLMTPCSAAVP